MTRFICALVMLACGAAPAMAQESRFQAELREEGEHIKESCSDLTVTAIGGCAVALAIESPFHLAVGSIAPQNGVGFGLAFVEHATPNERWKISWNADAVNAFSGAWRAGAYMKVIHIPDSAGITVRPAGASAQPATVAVREYPVFNLYAQTTSLDKLLFLVLVPTASNPGNRSTASKKPLSAPRRSCR